MMVLAELNLLGAPCDCMVGLGLVEWVGFLQERDLQANTRAGTEVVRELVGPMPEPGT